MRKPIFLATAAALAIALVALLSVNPLVRRNKDFLIGRAEQTLGRKIYAEQIEITFWPVGARLVNFALADDPDFSTEDLVRAKEMSVEFHLLPLLIGRFQPKRVSLVSPSITVVRDASGRYNFTSRNGGKGREGARGKKARPAEARDSLFLWLPATIISNGTLRYLDLSGGELTVTQFDFKSSDFEQGRPIEIELTAAVNADKPNLNLKSRIGPIGENRDFRDVLLDGEINATDLDLGKVNKALPRLRKSLPRVLRFDGVYTIKELRFKGPLNNLSLKGAVTGTDASFRFE
jgi:AsmA protein